MLSTAAKIEVPEERVLAPKSRAEIAALVASAEGVVRSVVRDYSRGLSVDDVEDLRQAGRVGAFIAARRFDSGREVSFATYARWWVRAYVQREVFGLWSKGRCHINKSTQKVFSGLGRARGEILDAGQEETPEALAEALGVDAAMLRDALSLTCRDAPFDEPSSRRSGSHLVALSDVVADDAEDSLSVLCGRASVVKVRAAVAALPDRERHVIESKYFGSRTFREIGPEIGVTGQRAERIEKIALRRLRHALSE